MTANPKTFSNQKCFTAARKLQILQRLDKLAAKRTEDNARLRHLLLCRNGITDEEIDAWRAGFERFGLSGLRPKRKQYLERLALEARAA